MMRIFYCRFSGQQTGETVLLEALGLEETGLIPLKLLKGDRWDLTQTCRYRPTGITTMVLRGVLCASWWGHYLGTVLYAPTCCFSGYVFSHCFWQIGGEHWVWDVILTTRLF